MLLSILQIATKKIGNKRRLIVNSKDILKLTATYLKLNSILDMSVLDGTNTEPNESDEKALELLLKCLNLKISEIAKDYIKLSTEEEITISDNSFLISNLTKNACEILKLYKNNTEVSFSLYPDSIKADSGTYIVRYNYIPEDIVLNEAIDSFYNKLSPQILAYGVASEFLFINSLYDEAEMYNNRFYSAIEQAVRRNSEIVIKVRVWIYKFIKKIIHLRSLKT